MTKTKTLLLCLLILCLAMLSSCAAESDEPFFSMTDAVTETDAPEESTAFESATDTDTATDTEEAPDTSVTETETDAPWQSGTEETPEESAAVQEPETDFESEDRTETEGIPPVSEESGAAENASSDTELPKEEPQTLTPAELLAAIRDQNLISAWLADNETVLVHLVAADENGIAQGKTWHYALADNEIFIDATVVDPFERLTSAYTVRGGAYYGMEGTDLFFFILPDTDADYLTRSFGFDFFPSGLTADSFSEENGGYRLIAQATGEDLGVGERMEYVFTVNKETLLLDAVEVSFLAADQEITRQTVTVTRSNEAYEPPMYAYNAHLNAEDAIRVYAQIKPQSAGETRIYTVSAASGIGAYPSADGTVFAVYKNEECTKNITDLSFGGGSDVRVYVSEWEGEISLAFTLSEDDLETFRAAVSEFETLALEGRAAAKMIEAYYEVDALFEFIDSQSVVAYVHYYSDLSNPYYQEEYMLAQSVNGEARALLNDAYAAIAASDSPFREILFAGWSEEELEALTADNSAIAAIEEENAALLTEYHGLMQDGTWGDEVNRIYETFVANNNAIAALAGYENYYEYASDAYNRDYGEAERTLFRQYVKEYVVPLYGDALTRFYAAYGALSMSQLEWVRVLSTDPYDAHSLTKRFIDGYIDSFTPSLAKKMSAMFEKDVMILGTAPNAYAGAFTTYLSLYEEPITYFGPGCTDLLTVIHENGHYAAFCNLGSSQIPGLDLCETHSQGNEWLFVSYLEDKLDPAVHEVLMLERLLNGLSVIIYATVVDECEELIYTAETPYSAEEYDSLIDSVIATYGDYAVENFTNLRTYFKLVAMNSPVYYLSYATSEMASMALYLVATEDFDAAIEAYTVLVDEVTGEDRFLSSLEKVGLPTPFGEDTFVMLTEVFGAYLGVAEEEIPVAA